MASRALLPGLTPNQEVPFRYRTQPMRVCACGLRTGAAFTFDPRQVQGNAKQNSIFLLFPVRPGIGVMLSAFTDCLRRRSDSGL